MNAIRSVRLMVVLCGAVMGAGCGIVENDEPAEEARVRLTGTSAVDLELVASPEFGIMIDQATGQREIVMIASDTSMIRPPFDQVFDISEHGMFMVRLRNWEESVADVEIEVWIDGSRRVRQQLLIAADTAGTPGSFEWSWLN